MVRSAKLFALVTLAALMSACSSQGNSMAPPVPQQPVMEQPMTDQPLSSAQSAMPLFPFRQPVADPQNVPLEPQAANAVAGPPVYVTDIHSRLWKITTGTNTIESIGSEGVQLTDLGIDPVNHVLYGISYTSLYRVSTTTGHATFVGRLGISNAVALVFAKNGTGYVAGLDNYNLYTMNASTGRMSVVGSMYPWTSAGDLTFYNTNYIVMSGQEFSITQSAPDFLIALDPANAQPITAANTGLPILLGIYSTGTNQLWGFAGTTLYHFTNSVVKVKNFASAGVGEIFGAAYDGAF